MSLVIGRLSLSDLLRPVEHFDFDRFLGRAPLQSTLVGGPDKRLKQRMGLQRFRLELRVELAPDEIRVLRNFDHLDVGTIRCRSGNPSPPATSVLSYSRLNS